MIEENNMDYCKCECGHSRNLHNHDYAEGITKTENCKECGCRIFKLNSEEKTKGKLK